MIHPEQAEKYPCVSEHIHHVSGFLFKIVFFIDF